MSDVCNTMAVILVLDISNSARFCPSTLSSLKLISRSIFKLQTAREFQDGSHLVFPTGTNFESNLT